MIEKIKKIYPLACILMFASSFLFLFRNHRFAADSEFLFTILPQPAIAKHIGFLGNFWNSYSGCGIPFFAQPWSKFYLILNIFFRFFDPKNAYILFLFFGFITAYFAFYYSAKYFYKEKYIAVLLALLYVSSGQIYGYYTVNYFHIEYFIMMPLIVMVLHKYIDRGKIAYLIILGLMSIYLQIGVGILVMTGSYILLNLFIIFFVYEKYRNIGKIIRYLILINGIIISVNLFKIIPTIQYYFIDGVRPPSAYVVAESLFRFIGPLHSLFLSGHMAMNLHFLSFFLLLSYFFYTPNLIEKISLKTCISFILIVYISCIVLHLFAHNIMKILNISSVHLYYILVYVHVPGTLMLGNGIRSFITSSNRKKEQKALLIFVIAWAFVYCLYVIRKQSFDIGIMQYVKWPFIFGVMFFLIIFISRNIQIRKLCALVAVLIFGMAFIHSSESHWFTDTSYRETYISNCNKEIVNALGIKPSCDLRHNDINGLYRIMGYMDKELNILGYVGRDVPFFSIVNYPILFGVSTIHHHDNVYLKRFFTFIDIVKTSGDIRHSGGGNNILFSPLFPLLNVKYLFSYDNIRVHGIKLHKELMDKKTKIYKNDNLFPRFFVADDFISYNSEEKFIEIVNERDTDFAKTVLIEGYSGNKQENNISMLDYKIKNFYYKNDSITLDLDVNKGSFLVVLDNYYSGWKAYINGSETRIYPAYLTFRSIRLPDAGSYKIEFKYRPIFFKEGVFIAITVFLFLCLGLIYQLKSPTKK